MSIFLSLGFFRSGLSSGSESVFSKYLILFNSLYFSLFFFSTALFMSSIFYFSFCIFEIFTSNSYLFCFNSFFLLSINFAGIPFAEFYASINKFHNSSIKVAVSFSIKPEI
jgi:hypothetical protein